MRGQSEVIGVVFLTGVIIILVGFVGLNVLSTLDTTTTSPTVNVDVEITATTVTLTHHGGDSLAAAETDVILADGSSNTVPLSDFTELQGDGDDRFEAGETWQHGHSKTDRIRVLVVHRGEEDSIVQSVWADVPN